MIAGLPIEAWMLFVFSIGLPLVIELKFYFTHRKRKTGSDGGSGS